MHFIVTPPFICEDYQVDVSEMSSTTGKNQEHYIDLRAEYVKLFLISSQETEIDNCKSMIVPCPKGMGPKAQDCFLCFTPFESHRQNQ